jgi:hypothetical protein
VLAEADVLKALRDELAGVAPSPEFTSRVRERVAGELPLLREELAAVMPSPEFKARVRQQIEAAGPARGAGWRWLVPATLAAAALLAVVLVPRRPETPAPMTPLPDLSHVTIVDGPLVRTGGTPPHPKALDARAGRTAAQTAASLLRSSNPPSAHGYGVRAFDVRSSKSEPAEGPSLEVITNQPAILKAMWAQISADAQIVETRTEPLPETAPEIVIPPIDIAPLVVKSLFEQSAIGGLFPIVRIITAQ